uniref:Uncharacterized protein n=1 Tax=Oryza sativa subsp. japonica TaxID=39947 RepID=Q6EQA4_ORYSJ|nr:hypothetical protein [Oryza sativa Japonica Group]BAD29166.1 hypothetical protein [Oryza sativa Japonica Group]
MAASAAKRRHPRRLLSAAIRVGVDGLGACSGGGQGVGDGVDAAAVLTARGAANRVGVAIDVKGGTCTVAAAAFLLISRLPSVPNPPLTRPVDNPR